MELIRELRSDHARMLATLDRIKAAGVTSEEGQRLLREGKDLLLTHLRKEDERFYPVLHRAAQEDPALRRRLEAFAEDMREVSRNAIDFFDRYAQGGSGLGFARDFGRLYATLRQRQEKEERLLYPEFARTA